MYMYLQEVKRKKTFFFNYFFVGILGRSMTKIAGSASESISKRYGSADPDPDPPHNVMDPQHCSQDPLAESEAADQMDRSAQTSCFRFRLDQNCHGLVFTLVADLFA
jgi:hypothetical protein